VGWQRREERRALDRERVKRIAEGRHEWYHTVTRGEAVASIAKMFNTTPEQIRALNSLTNDKIRIGQVLKVKARTAQPVAFPAGIAPEMSP
jgi:LysM repeat protein